jgi:CspA family cold shock protein
MKRGNMAEGTVKWFGGKTHEGKTRGYGFITQDNGEDLFVYYKEIEKEKEGFKTLDEGQRVSFEVEPGQDGKMQAVNVVKL